ncbi:substrate-binding periplasmic protein [Chitinolyticbacter meiyuanensis]|uniref:substrate-binding periplasmic protein n=1 Tax=Chitinolyticbacter meiyuanensis TaxID=682798 RepID=UPI0011E5A250|nr:transporter substrate-binding domain-containing protein [Chitinolyticbacter meiyuanensis]
MHRLALLLAMPAVLAAEPRLTILYHDRAPLYHLGHGGRLTGTVYANVRAALDAAGLDAQFVSVPAKRQLAEVERNQAPVCALGWLMTAERRRYARFSAPIHYERPWLVVTRRQHTVAVRQLGALHALLPSDRLQLILLDGASYGSYIDGLLHRQPAIRVTTDADNLLRMLDAGRGDYTIQPPDVLEHYLATHPESQLQSPMLADVIGEPLYLICSRRVDEDWLHRFNAALKVKRPR